MKLSEALENNIKMLTSCKTCEEVYRKTNWVINHNRIEDTKKATDLQKRLEKQKDLNKSFEILINYTLDDFGIGRTVEKKSWFKGNPIHGMECSNPYR